jgi:hypothetical protein
MVAAAGAKCLDQSVQTSRWNCSMHDVCCNVAAGAHTGGQRMLPTTFQVMPLTVTPFHQSVCVAVEPPMLIWRSQWSTRVVCNRANLPEMPNARHLSKPATICSSSSLICKLTFKPKQSPPLRASQMNAENAHISLCTTNIPHTSTAACTTIAN